MDNQHNFTLKRFFSALLAFFVVNIFAGVFILPWSVWIAATVRMGKLFEEGGILINLRKSEAIVINWFKYFLDGLIFISYVIGFIVSLFLLSQNGFLAFLGGLAASYLFPLAISFVKEFLLVLPLGKYLKLEEIADNTKTNKV